MLAPQPRFVGSHLVALSLLTVIVGSVAAACGRSGGDDPVATVTARLDRTVVPLGGPANLDLEFVAASTLRPLTEDYRVMVHFLDSNGDMMWAADHDPPTPTSQWQPGQRISYSHRLHIPMYPYIGDAVVAVGLYSATTGERLVLAGDDLGQRSYRGTEVVLEPQPESSFLMYQDGWYDDEFNPESNESWRWTAGRASLAFRNPGTGAALSLEFDGRSELFDPPQRVTFRLGDVVVYEAVVDTAERQFHEVNLAQEQMGDADIVTLELDIDQTFVPSAIPGAAPGDERSLGIRVFYTFLEPR